MNKDDHDSLPRPREFFDLAGGTSTGGYKVLARSSISLTNLDRPICLIFFRPVSYSIFFPAPL
jgi:hypothetical protein